MNYESERTNDLILLSTYLDQALNEKDEKQLRARLQREPELRQQLDALRQTKMLVGHLPRVKAPRNFTLTPQMVKVRKRKPQPLFNFLRLASSLAAILLVVLFGLELLTSPGFLRMPQMASDTALEAATAADEAPPQPLILWGEVGRGGGNEEGVSGMGNDSFIAKDSPVEMEALPPESEFEQEVFIPEPAMEAESLPEEEPEIMLAPMEEAEAFALEAPPAEDASPILGVNPQAAGEIIERSQPDGQEQAVDWPLVFRWVQITLAVIAIGGALILLILHIQQRQPA